MTKYNGPDRRRTAGMTKLSNTEVICFVLGQQGGTVHDIARRLMVSVDTIITADADIMRDLCRAAQRVALMP